MRPSANRPYGRVFSITLAAMLANSCAGGRLSPSAVIGPERMGQPIIGAQVFSPAMANTCFRYGQRKGSSLRPGDRLKIDVLAVGTQDYNYKNAFPPLVRTIDVPIRRVEQDGLDLAEQQALATLLQVNRSPAWNHDTSEEGDGITRTERQTLAQELRAREASLWNAFVDSSCVKAGAAGPGGAPVLVLQFDIRALCNALPEASEPSGNSPRQRFARAFLVSSNTDPEYLKGCSAQATTREPMTAVGLRGDPALGDWASTALAANAIEGDDYYSQDLPLASPKAVQGFVAYEAVAPFRPDPPNWSLQEWERSGICAGPQAQALVLKALRLREGGQTFRIVEDPGYTTTHKIEVTAGRRTLVTQRKQVLDWSLPRSALSVLTAADVDALVWASERARRSPTVRPPGCAHRREG